jgi:class 3 adenylate cyclase/tetratricopeptide (TPR) repeat protein
MELSAFLPRTLRARLGAMPGHPLRLAGATLFADVSGFTPLSEALAKMGRGGAEELTRALNGCFEPIIETIHARDGDVMRFAGDAVTVFFGGEAAEENAIRAAFEIQALMRERSEIESPVGRFPIRIKIGVAVGEHLLEAVGEEARRDYVFSGAPVDGAAEAEHRAEPGEVVLHPGCRRAGGAFARLAPSDEPAPPPISIAGADGLSSGLCRPFVHPAIAEKALAGRSELLNELRRASILFVSFASSNLDLDSFYREVRALVDGYDGLLNKVDMGDKGAKLLVTFGAPISHEDDADRAVHLAGDLVELGERLGIALSAGIDTGIIFSGIIGSPSRCEYTVMGDHVNLAARLMQMAGAGGILVGEATRKAASSHAYQPLPPARVKGKAEPVAIFRPTSREAGHREATSTFVGREAELRRLREILAGADREPRLVWIRGEAGIGKSSLWRRAEAALPPNTFVAVASCRPFASAIPFRPWRHFLRTLLGELAGESTPSDAWISLLRTRYPEMVPFGRLLADLAGIPHALPEVEADPQTRASLLERSVRILMSESASRRPFVALFTDLQWIDVESRQLLETLLRRLEPPSPVVVVTSRETPAELDGIVETFDLLLPPLSDDETRELARKRLGVERVPEALSRALLDASRGHPLLLEETIRSFVESGYVSRSEESPDILLLDETLKPATAASLEEVAMARFDRLGADEQAILKALSIFGGSIEPELVEAVAEDGDLSRAALSLLLDGRGLLARRDDGRIAFAEELFRSTIEGSLDSVSRRTFHLRGARAIARLLPSGTPSREERLAHHFLEAAATKEGKEAILVAARRAKEALALPTALRFLRALLDAPGLLAGEELADVAGSFGEILLQLGRFGEALEWIEDPLVFRVPSGDGRSRLLRLRGDAARSMGRLDEAASSLDRAEREASSDLERFRARAMAGTVLAQKNELPTAAAHFDRLIAELGDRVPPIELARTATTRGGILSMTGKREAAFALWDGARKELLAQNEVLPAVKIMHNMGFLEGVSGRHEASLATFEESRRLQERYGISQFLATTTNEIGLESMLLGRWKDAAYSLRYAFGVARRYHDPVETRVLINLGELAQCAGAIAESRHWLAEASRSAGADQMAHEILFSWIELAASLPDRYTLPRLLTRFQTLIETRNLGVFRYLQYAYLAHSLVLEGNLRGARLLAERTLRQAREVGLAKETYLCLRSLALAQEEPAKRRALLIQLSDAAMKTGLRQYLLEVIVLRLEDGEMTPALFDDGERILDETPFANLGWRFHLVAAVDARERGDESRARTSAAQAFSFLDFFLATVRRPGLRGRLAEQPAALRVKALRGSLPDLEPAPLPELIRRIAGID